MDFDFQPVNYSGLLGLDREPDPRVLRQQQQQIDQQGQQVQVQRQMQAAKMAEEARKAQLQQSYQSEVSAVIAKPTPEGFAALQMRYPEQATAIKGAFEQREKGAQDADFKHMARVYGLLGAGRIDDAKKDLQGRIEAGKAAGVDVSDDEQLLTQIDADPTKAQGALGYVMSSVGGAEKFAAIHEQLRLAGKGGDGFTLGAGDIRYDSAGNIIAASPYKPTLERGPNGELIEYTPGGGSGGPSGGFDGIMEKWMFPVEGGYSATDGNSGAPVNFGINQKANPDIDVKNLTRDQAKQLYLDRYWKPSGADKITDPKMQAVHMDTAVNMGVKVANGMLAQAGGDPQKYLELREQRYRRIGGSDLPVWLKRNTDLASFVGGSGQAGGSSIRVLTPPKAPEPKTTILTPTEIAAIPGLDPNTVYQKKPDGTIEAVGGQSRSQLKPWPAAALASRTTQNAALTNIRGAIRLLDPNNKSPEARRAREAIGFGTGLLGDRFTQWNDPEGTPARARIGQIGGIIIKDTSGAAVSLSEDQRLAKWVPLVTDSPSVARDKLRNLERELAQRNQAMDDTYSEDQGFRPFSRGGQQASSGQQPGGFRILRVRPK